MTDPPASAPGTPPLDEVIIAISNEEFGLGEALASELAYFLAGRLALPADTAEVTNADFAAQGVILMTPEQHATAVAKALVARVGRGALLATAGSRANRWSGKTSVVEHLLDRGHPRVLSVGPRVRAIRTPGPVLVAVDGSVPVTMALDDAQRLAAAFDTNIELIRVIPEWSDEDVRVTATAELRAAAPPGAATVVVVANDHVRALTNQAATTRSPLLVAVSHGDRTAARATMARTSSGLIHESPCPVLVVSPPR